MTWKRQGRAKPLRMIHIISRQPFYLCANLLSFDVSQEEDRDSLSCAIPLHVEPMNQKNGLCSDFSHTEVY